MKRLTDKELVTREAENAALRAVRSTIYGDKKWNAWRSEVGDALGAWILRRRAARDAKGGGK